MKSIILLISACTCYFLFGCSSSELDCTDLQIEPAFIGFDTAKTNTFIIRKFKADDGFQTLLDTSIIKNELSLSDYKRYHDTTIVYIYAYNKNINDIRTGFDWEIYIPASARTFRVTEIKSEKKTGKCHNGIFSMDKFGCVCFNEINSLKIDSRLYTFSNVARKEQCIIYLRN